MRFSAGLGVVNRLGGPSLTLAVTLSCLPACAVPHVPARVIYENPTSFVRLEPDPDAVPHAPETMHSHPASLSAEVIAEILRGITVREQRTFIQTWFLGEAPREQAFRAEEVLWLAPQLAAALDKSAPNERITYYLSYPQTSVKREITSGGLYIKDGELHFVLSNQREIYGIPAYGMVYDRRYPMLPIAPKGFIVLFEPAEAVVEMTVSLWDRMWGLEKDEIVINLTKLRPPKSVASVPLSGRARRPWPP